MIYYVDNLKGDNSNDGLSKCTPKATINGVINIFNTSEDNIIYVNEGIYYLNNKSFSIKNPRLIFIDHSNIKALKLEPNKNVAFILINLSELENKNVKFKNKYKMMCSNDLLQWDFYYDDCNYNSITIEKFDINVLKKCMNTKCKAIDTIDNKYNYILLKLDKNDNLKYIYESTKATHIKTENNNITVEENSYKIKSNSTSIEVFIMDKNDECILSLDDMGGDDE